MQINQLAAQHEIREREEQGQRADAQTALTTQTSLSNSLLCRLVHLAGRLTRQALSNAFLSRSYETLLAEAHQRLIASGASNQRLAAALRRLGPTA